MSIFTNWHNLGYLYNIFLKGLGLKLKGAHFHEPLSFLIPCTSSYCLTEHLVLLPENKHYNAWKGWDELVKSRNKCLKYWFRATGATSFAVTESNANRQIIGCRNSGEIVPIFQSGPPPDCTGGRIYTW
jgi:hypothetical protein